jgi:hypothetical protein
MRVFLVSVLNAMVLFFYLRLVVVMSSVGYVIVLYSVCL